MSAVEGATPRPRRYLWHEGILDSDLTTKAKMVATVLLRFMGTDARCWPSQATIGAMASLSERTVQAAIHELVGAGWLQVEQHFTEDGRQQPNHYLALTAPALRLVPPGGRELRGEGATVAHPGGQESPGEGATVAHEQVQRTAPEEQPQGTALAVPSRRERNPLFDAVAEVCGIDAGDISRTMGKRLGRVVAELREVEATPDEVRRRAGVYRSEWPDCTLTPEALMKHYAQMRASQRVDPVLASIVATAEANGWDLRQGMESLTDPTRLG